MLFGRKCVIFLTVLRFMLKRINYKFIFLNNKYTNLNAPAPIRSIIETSIALQLKCYLFATRLKLDPTQKHKSTGVHASSNICKKSLCDNLEIQRYYTFIKIVKPLIEEIYYIKKFFYFLAC